MGYRNCVYDSKEQCVHLFTWDENGKRIKVEASYNPYLYIESTKGEALSIFNTKLTKKSFRNSFELNKFLKDSGVKRVFENLNVVQHFLLDMFWREHDKPEFFTNPLKVCSLDIEVYGGNKSGFASPEDPVHCVNVITCYDSISKTFHTFGTKEYNNTNPDVVYTHCRSEKDLFIKFIEYFEQDYPDVISGWHICGYDIPYITNRCTRILGEEYTKRLSPVGVVRTREYMGSYGKMEKKYYYDGISILDYLELYKRFTMKEHESYKLDNIAEVELGQNKVKFGNISLDELADTDWDKFVTYNIQDVKIVADLDEKLQFISLLRAVAHSGLCTLEQSMGTVTSATGALAIKAREQGKVLSTFVRNAVDGINPGAFVAEPKKGFQEYFAYFDASSLYPNTMITLNMSPETKVGKLIKEQDGYSVQHVSGKEFKLTDKQLEVLMKKEQLCLSKADILFTQKFKGIIPLFLEDTYNKRIKIRNLMLLKKKQLSDIKKITNIIDITKKQQLQDKVSQLTDEISKLNNIQTSLKLQLNSLYGVMGNKHAVIGDDDLASSTTLTGQAVIKQAAQIYTEYLNEKYNIIQTVDECRVYGDTDSCFRDTLINTDIGLFEIESLWNHFNRNDLSFTIYGHEVIKDINLKVKTFDINTNKITFKQIKHLVRHKVSKQQFKINVGSKSIRMTGDHGCLVYRDGNLIRVSAKDIVKGDKMLIHKPVSP